VQKSIKTQGKEYIMKPKQHIDKIRIIWREYKRKAQHLKIKSKSSFTPSYTIKPKQKGLATSR
jgi:predicted amidohydrolase